MPTDLFYTTGQAARELGVSPATVRALCAGGVIDCQSTRGGQYRVPKSAVEKCRRDGLPAVPRPLPDDNVRPVRPRHGHAALLAEPSEDAKAAADEVVVLENEVKSLGLKRQKVEQTEWFLDRERRKAEAEAAREAAEQERQERAEEERRRQEWTDRWLAHALRSMPYDAPEETRLDVQEQVETALDKLQPSQPDYIVERLVHAAVDRALKPWQRRKEIEAAIEQASDSLPPQAKGFSWNPSEWDIRARQAAAAAIGRLRDGATAEEIRATARDAVQHIIKQFEHEEACKLVLAGCTLSLRGETSEEREEAKAAVKAALDALPVGATRREMERARDEVLTPIQAAIDKRQEQARRQQEAARKQSEAESRATWRLTHVNDYLGQLEEDGDLEFDDLSDRWRTADKLKDLIRPILVKELCANPGMTDQHVERRIERLVDERLDVVLD